MPALVPLWSMLAVSRRIDGAVVKLGTASFVVTARPLHPEHTEDTGSDGMVATLVEPIARRRSRSGITATRPRYGFRDLVGTSEALR